MYRDKWFFMLFSSVLSALATGHLLASEFSGIPETDRPNVHVAMLESNHLNEHRGVMFADRATGVLQISELVMQTRYEEQWAYIPSANIWIEVGRNEVASSKDSEVELDFDYLERIVGIYDLVHIVHFHPAHFYNTGRWRQGIFPKSYNAADLMGSEIEVIGLALPSPADVAASVRLIELLGGKNSALNLRFSVISPYGQVSYGANASMQVQILRNVGNPRMNYARELAVGIAIRRGRKNIEHIISSKIRPSIAEVIVELCRQQSSEDYLITFEPVNLFQVDEGN